MDIYFDSSYIKNDTILIEVPPHLLEIIENNEDMIIKGNEISLLCTNSESFELKELENSNTYFLLSDETPANLQGNNKYEVLLMTNHTLDCDSVTPKKYHVIQELKDHCAIRYDLSTGLNNTEGI